MTTLDPVGGNALLPSSQPQQRLSCGRGPVPCDGGELGCRGPGKELLLDEEELEVEARDTKMEGTERRGEASVAARAEDDRQGAAAPVDTREPNCHGWMRDREEKLQEDILFCETDSFSLFASYPAFAYAGPLCY
jgi:hypothetical protein